MKDSTFPARLDALDALLMRRDDVISFLHSGQMIKAIKLYREDTGASLADAKAAVERLEQRMRLGMLPQVPMEQAVTAGPLDTGAWRNEVERLIQQQSKIQAIKFYREQTGVGLREAKNVIDQIASEMQLSGLSYSQPGAWAAETLRYTEPPLVARNSDKNVLSLVLKGRENQCYQVVSRADGCWAV